MNARVIIDAVNTKETSKGTIFLVQAGGTEYSTFQGGIGRDARNLIGHPADISFTEKQNGQFTNRYLESVGAVSGASEPFPAAASGPVTTPLGDVMGRNNIAAGAVGALIASSDGKPETFQGILDGLAEWSKSGRAFLVPSRNLSSDNDIPF